VLLNASGCLDALTAPDVARALDAFVTKTVTPLPRDGNTPVRIAETDVGMLNSIGLANPGIDRFVTRNLPPLGELGVPVFTEIPSEQLGASVLCGHAVAAPGWARLRLPRAAAGLARKLAGYTPPEAASAAAAREEVGAP